MGPLSFKILAMAGLAACTVVDQQPVGVSATQCTSASKFHAHAVPYLEFINDGFMGSIDAGAVLPLLVRSFRRYSRLHDAPTLIDVGANIGGASAVMLQLFSALPIIQDHAAFGNVQPSDVRLAELLRVRVFAFEPVPSVYERLAARATRDSWPLAGWVGAKLAISDKEGINFIYTGDPTNRHYMASLSEGAAQLQPGLTAMEQHPVLTLTLPGAASQLNISEGFLLKIDVEGHDPHVLVGAKPFLQERRFEWMLFEYNKQWSLVTSPAMDDGLVLNTLESISQWLHRMGYLCYLITDYVLLPLYGAYWHPSYEINAWSNVLCGLTAPEVSQPAPSSGASGSGSGSGAGLGGPILVGQAPLANRPSGTPSAETQAVVAFYNSGLLEFQGGDLPPCES